MKIFAISVAVLVLATPASARDRMVDGFPDLPPDAQEVAERSLACQHFWGEVNGTGDGRDQQVAERLSELQCDQIEQDLQQMRTKYQASERILEILSEAALD